MTRPPQDLVPPPVDAPPVDALPTISAGAHDPGDGEACVMEYVALLAGEPWSDRPACTHPLLAHEARTANDLLPDDERGRLVPLVGRLFGTSADSPAIRTELRLEQARQVLQLVEPSARPAVVPHLDRARHLLTVADTDLGAEVDAAVATARHLPTRASGLDEAHVAHHRGAARIMAFVASPDLGAAEAWATTALAASHALAAAECRADCGDPVARGRRAVRDLSRLVDVHDRLTGRVAPDPAVTAEHLSRLGAGR